MYREDFLSRIERFVLPAGAALGSIMGAAAVLLFALHKTSI